MLVASHPRSGTHLTIDLIRKQFPACRSWKWPGQYVQTLYLTLEHVYPQHKHYVSETRALRRLDSALMPLIKTHQPPDLPVLSHTSADFRAHILNNSIKVYVVRDPRDVFCSEHLWMIARGRIEPGVSVGEFLRMRGPDGTIYPQHWVAHVQGWMEHDGVLLIRYEDVLRDTEGTLRKLAGALHQDPLMREPLLPARFKTTTLWKLGRILSMNPESTAVPGRFPGLKLVKWRDAFTAQDHELVRETCGELMARLGYE